MILKGISRVNSQKYNNFVLLYLYFTKSCIFRTFRWIPINQFNCNIYGGHLSMTVQPQKLIGWEGHNKNQSKCVYYKKWTSGQFYKNQCVFCIKCLLGLFFSLFLKTDSFHFIILWLAMTHFGDSYIYLFWNPFPRFKRMLECYKPFSLLCSVQCLFVLKLVQTN